MPLCTHLLLFACHMRMDVYRVRTHTHTQSTQWTLKVAKFSWKWHCLPKQSMRFIMMKSVNVLAHKNFFSTWSKKQQQQQQKQSHTFIESLTMECVDNNTASVFENVLLWWIEWCGSVRSSLAMDFAHFYVSFTLIFFFFLHKIHC